MLERDASRKALTKTESAWTFTLCVWIFADPKMQLASSRTKRVTPRKRRERTDVRSVFYQDGGTISPYDLQCFFFFYAEEEEINPLKKNPGSSWIRTQDLLNTSHYLATWTPGRGAEDNLHT